MTDDLIAALRRRGVPMTTPEREAAADRIAELELTLQLIVNECSTHTFGKPGYDATLDNIHDNALAVLASVASTPPTPEEPVVDGVGAEGIESAR